MNRRNFLKILSLLALYSPIVSSITKKKKITVVGAGIIGTCIAYELCKAGINVSLIDKAHPASGTTGSSFNWINATYPKKPYSYNLLSQMGINAYKELQNKIDFPILWNGSLEWMDSPNDQDKLLQEVINLQNYPTHSKHEIINTREANLFEPNIDFKNNQNIVFSKSDGAVDVDILISSLIAKIKNYGGNIYSQCEYKDLIYRNNKLSSIKTSIGDIQSDQVIFACGIHTDSILPISSLNTPTPGVIMKSKPLSKTINKIIVGPGIHLHQQIDGKIIFGEQEGAPYNHKDRLKNLPNKFPSNVFEKQHVDRILNMTKSFVSNIDNVEIEKVSIGWRPLPKDGKPVIGRIKNLPGTYVAVMHSGISLGPIVGKLVAQEITENIENIALNDFRPTRFS